MYRQTIHVTCTIVVIGTLNKPMLLVNILALKRKIKCTIFVLLNSLYNKSSIDIALEF